MPEGGEAHGSRKEDCVLTTQSLYVPPDAGISVQLLSTMSPIQLGETGSCPQGASGITKELVGKDWLPMREPQGLLGHTQDRSPKPRGEGPPRGKTWVGGGGI